MAVVQGVIAVATIKFVSYLYRNVDNLYLFVLSLIPFVIIIKIISPVAYFTVWSITLFYVLFILLAIFKGKTSDDTKHMTVTEMYLALRDDIFKQKIIAYAYTVTIIAFPESKLPIGVLDMLRGSPQR